MSDRKRMCLGAGLVIATIAVAATTGCGWTNGMIFHPPAPSYSSKDVQLVRRKNYGVAVKYLSNESAKYLILYSHGNAEDLGHTMPLMRRFRDAGFAVVTYDYLGYGLSRDFNGRGPSEKGAYRSAELAYSYVTRRLKIPPERIIIVGRSVGSGPATYLAERHESAGLVLISPFVSAYRVVTKYPILPFDKFKNLKRIAKVKEPLLVIHGMDDRVIPIWHGKKIHSNAPGLKRALWLPGAGHNDLFYRKGDVALRGIVEFSKTLSNDEIVTQEK